MTPVSAGFVAGGSVGCVAFGSVDCGLSAVGCAASDDAGDVACGDDSCVSADDSRGSLLVDGLVDFSDGFVACELSVEDLQPGGFCVSFPQAVKTDASRANASAKQATLFMLFPLCYYSGAAGEIHVQTVSNLDTGKEPFYEYGTVGRSCSSVHRTSCHTAAAAGSYKRHPRMVSGQ